MAIFYFARCVCKLALYSDVIHLFDWKSAVEHDGGPGLHLEIDPRGGEMSIYEKEGGRSPVYMRG